jgi:DNA integrity scanning protein DisA with diadenylate cyclase activity
MHIHLDNPHLKPDNPKDTIGCAPAELLDLMNIRLAIRWMLRSRNNYISNMTIYNCFRKSTLVISPISLPVSIGSPDISTLYEEVQSVGNIRDAMAISSFLNPIEEQEETETEELSPDEVLQDVINEHLGSGVPFSIYYFDMFTPMEI